ncbi:hypothetical protein [Paraflavitalea speifideaquila]|uniref:hypothetical protein n=1 Tax=Paraflavitalea speifideaquila TaxID=3076558 RepID=UPI0028EF96CE|nr:hypothetical protein [Paraflavitalea speifideiaquila]
MFKQLLFVCLTLSGYASVAQETAPTDSVPAIALHNAITSYHHYIDKQSRLYNGVEFLVIRPRSKAYLITWKIPGSVEALYMMVLLMIRFK